MSYSSGGTRDVDEKTNKNKLITVYSSGVALISCYGTIKVISNSCIEFTSVEGKKYTVHNATVIVEE